VPELSVREHMSLIIKKLGKDQLISFDSFFNEEKGSYSQSW
jgi:hypothetical protein